MIVLAPLVALAVLVVVVFDPLGTAVAALPLPGLPDVPHPPGWARWILHGAVFLAILLALVSDSREGKDRADDGDAG